MSVPRQIDAYLASLPAPKRADLQALHEAILALRPSAKQWFLDGKDESGRTISNPNIGYGSQRISYADGSDREFYQVGISANTTGTSVYIMGLKDKSYLAQTYAKTIGKAKVTGYCIKFKALNQVDVKVLMEAVADGFGQTGSP